MKVGKHLVGRMVEIQWKDPTSGRMELAQAPKGRAALSTWIERGVVDDVTDGVVRIVHSAGRNPGATETDEVQYTSVDDALIERIVVFEPKEEIAQ
jgi:hypothetical protein